MYNPQLETFLCVAECGSFNKAAEKLFISPPAVIKQINLLPVITSHKIRAPDTDAPYRLLPSIIFPENKIRFLSYLPRDVSRVLYLMLSGK